MNPYERRIIHSAPQNDKFVETYSEGEEPYRKVVINYKKSNKKISSTNTVRIILIDREIIKRIIRNIKESKARATGKIHKTLLN